MDNKDLRVLDLSFDFEGSTRMEFADVPADYAGRRSSVGWSAFLLGGPEGHGRERG